jgi:hypothetical protein
MFADKNKKRITSTLVIVTSVIGMFLYLSGFNFSRAQVASQINVTVHLRNKQDKELTNGKYQVRFAIYQINRETADPYPSDTDAGQRVWEETQEVEIKNGVLDAYLGTVNPIADSFNEAEYYLGLRIAEDSEMVPRKKLAQVPNAINSSYLRGSTVGTNAGDILQLGTGGKVNIVQLPTGTGNNQLVLGNDSRLGTADNLTSTTELEFTIGSNSGLSNNFSFGVSNQSNKPQLRFNGSARVWQFSNNGTTFQDLGMGEVTGDFLPLSGGVMTGNISFTVGQTFSGTTLTEMGYLSGVTSNIQTQINGLSGNYLPLAGGTMTGNISFAIGQTFSGATLTEAGYLSGVTSAIQNQINAKSNLIHLHDASDISSGILAPNYGGTGIRNFPTGTLLYAFPDNTWSLLGIGTEGQVLGSVSGVPHWVDTATGAQHSLLSFSHSDTTADTPQRGDIITGQGAVNPKWTRLTIGSAGTSLLSDGSDVGWRQLTKSDVGLSNVENTALSTWSGSANITTLGTVASGTWNAAAIGLTKGGLGTNASSFSGLVKISGGAASYITDSSTNWSTAYAHTSIVGNPHGTVKADISLGNVENTALSTWVGSANITTVGTITSGIWNGASVSAQNGGTGISVYTLGDILYYESGNTLKTLPIGLDGQVLVVSGSTPAWSNSAPSSGHNLLSTAHGDTTASLPSRGALVTGQGITPTKWAKLSVGLDGDVLQVNSDGDIIWGKIGASGVGIAPDSLDFSEFKDILTLDSDLTINQSASNYSISIANTLFVDTANSRLGIGNTTPAALLSIGSTSQFQVNSAGAIAAATGISSSGTINFSGLTASKVVFTDASKNLTSTGTVAANQGGTGFNTYTIGDMLYAGSATTLSALADVATGNVLISGGVGTAPSWGKVGLATHISGTLGTGNGGTGITGTPTNGQLLIGNGSGYSLQTLTEGTNIAISNGSGSIILSTILTPSFSSVNSLSLNAAADGFSISGGTAPQTLTITGGSVTINGGGNTLTLTGSSFLNQSLLTTTSPTFAGLTLNGNLVLGANTLTTSNTTVITNLNADLLDGNHAAAFQLALTNPVIGTGVTNYLSKFSGTSAITNSLVYDNGTGVGIGTTSPLGKLDIRTSGSDGGFTVCFSSSPFDEWFSVGNGAGGLVQFNTSGGYAVAGPTDLGARFNISTINDTKSTLSIRGYTGGVSDIVRVSSPSVVTGDYFIIKANGNVGIGTTSPGEKLDVSGNIKLSSGGYIYGDTNSPFIQLSSVNGTFIGYTNTNSIAFTSADQRFTTNGLERFRIANNGNVGIGTTNPLNLLSLIQNTTTGNALNISRNLGAASTDSALVSLTQSNSGDDQHVLNISNAGTGEGLHIGQGAGATGYALEIYSNVDSSANSALMYITADNSAFDMPALGIQNDGTGSGISVANNGTGIGAYISQGTTGTNNGLQVYSNVDASTNSPLAYFQVANSAFDQNVMGIVNAGTGHGLSITNNGTGYGEYITQNGTNNGLYVYSNVDATANAALALIQVANSAFDNNALGIQNAGTGYGLSINNTGTNSGLYVISNLGGTSTNALADIEVTNAAYNAAALKVSNAGTGNGIYVNNTGTGYGVQINQGTAGTNNGLYVTSNVDSSVNQALALIQVSNTAFDTNAFSVINPGTGNAINVTNSGSGNGLNITQSGNSATNNALSVSSNANSSVSGALVSFTTSDATFDTNLLYISNAGTGSGIYLTSGNTGTLATLLSSGAVTTADGINISASNGSGVITDALDVSDPEIVNALNVGANTITGAGYLLTSTGSGLTINSTSADLSIQTTTSGNITLVPGGTGKVGVGTTAPSQIFQINNSGSNPFVVTSSGSVGIGTTAPTNKLDIIGSGGGVAGVYLNSAIPSSISYALYNNSGTLMWNGNIVSTSGPSLSGTTGRIPKFTSTSSVGDSVMFESGGNIGVGTTTPSALFSVGTGVTSPFQIDSNGNIIRLNNVSLSWPGSNGSGLMRNNGSGTLSWDASAYITTTNVSGTTNYLAKFTGANTVNSSSTLYEAGGNLGINTTAPSQIFQINNSNSNPFVVMSGGNVGIGNTSPNAKLTVGSPLSGTVLGSTFITNAGALGATAGNSLTLANIGFTSTNTSSLGMRAYRLSNGSDWTTTAITLGMDVDSTINAGAYLTFKGGSSGNVGIGTSNPTSKLDVNGDLRVGGAGDIANYYYLTQSRIVGGGDVDWDFLVYNAGNLKTIMTFDQSSASVGIGTTVPSTTLHVRDSASGVQITTETNSNVGGIALANTGTGGLTWRILSSMNSSSYGGSKFIIDQNASGTAKLVIDSSGNVGIGTTVPNQRLSVQSSGGSTSVITMLNSSGSIRGSMYLYANQSGSLYLNDSNGINKINLATEDVSYFNGGNVGIGTTAPTQKLSVAGVIQSTSGGIMFPDSSVQLIAAGSGVWGVNGTKIYYNTGNVGIGTSDPGHILDVLVAGGNESALKLKQTGQASMMIGSKANDSNIYISNTYASDSDFGVAGKTITLNTSGFVGIGTTAPTQALELGASRWLSFEGVTDDAFETIFQVIDATVSDKTISFQNNSGIVPLSTAGNTVFFTTSGATSITLPTSGTMLVSPMTTAGDIIFGSAGGAATRLAGASTNGWILKYNTSTSAPYWTAETAGTTYTAGNDIDFNVAQIDLEPQLDFVTTITRASSNLTLSTTTSGTLALNSAGALNFSAGAASTFDLPNSAVNAWNIESGLMSFDTNNLRVGIGTTSPGAKLDVNGGINVSASNVITFGNSGPGGSPGGFQWLMTNDGASMYVSEVVADQTDYVFKLWDNTTQDRYVWWIDDFRGSSYDVYPMILAGDYGNFYGGRFYINNNNGNVGIGTTNPLFNLQVNGGAGSIALGPNGGAVMPVLSREGSQGGLSIDKYTSTGVFSANLMTILGGGNIGIGTTNPQSLLEVRSDTNARLTINRTGAWGASPGDIKFNANDAGTDYWTLGMEPDTTNNFYLNRNAANYVTFKDGGNVGIGSSAPTSLLEVMGTVQLHGASGQVGLYANSSGNVGVGTTNPSTKLHIYGTDASGSMLTLERSSSTYGPGLDFLEGGIKSWEIKQDIDGSDSGSLQFASGASNNIRVTLQSGGNVGIGTTNPVQKLDIFQGNMNINSAGSGSQAIIFQEVSTNMMDIAYDGLGIGTANAIRIRDREGGTTDLVTFQKGGNVGIGTTSPTSRFAVEDWGHSIASADYVSSSILTSFSGTLVADHSGAGLQVMTFNGASPNGHTLNNYGIIGYAFNQAGYTATEINGIAGVGQGSHTAGTVDTVRGLFGQAIQNGAGGTIANAVGVQGQAVQSAGTITNAWGGFFTASGANPVGVYAGNGISTANLAYGSFGLYTDNGGYFGGNVGIGTTNPGQKLSVSDGFIELTNDYGLIWGDTTTGIAGSGWSDYLVFATNNLERITINSSGNVGIGTTAPSELLDVNGRIHLAQTTAPISVNDKLYNVSGNLVWNGVNLTGGGSLPTGTEGQMIYNNGGNWTAFAGMYWDDTNNRLGIGTTNPAGKLSLAGNSSQAAWSTNGPGLNIAAATYADTTSSGTVTNMTAINTLAVPNIAATSTTYNKISNLYVAGAPTVSGSGTTVVEQSALYTDTYAATGSASAYGIYVNEPTGTNSMGVRIKKGTNDIQLSAGYIKLTYGLANINNINNSIIYASDNGAYITRNIADANAALSVQQQNSSSTGDILTLSNYSGTVFVVKPDGKVGINTPSPNALFSVGSASQFQVNGSGQVTSGSWNGTSVGLTYGGMGANVSAYNGLVKISGGTASAVTDNSSNWNTAYSHSNLTGNPHSTTKADLSLGSVENTALSTWAGSANLATVGTVTSGTWNGSRIASQYGGLGIDTSSSSGVPVVSYGVWSVETSLPISLGGTGQTATPSNGQLLIGTGTGFQLGTLTAGTGVAISNSSGSISITNSGVTSLAGTTNQVSVSAATGSITLSLPQSIATSSTPTFSGMTLSGFNSGQVIYAGASGVMSQDSNFNWDATNHRMGIITASPSATFSVGSSSQFQVNATGQATANDGFVQKIVSGNCSDGNFTTATNGLICIDSSNGRIYMRYGGNWHYVNQTGGFQIPNYETAPNEELAGQALADAENALPFERSNYPDYLAGNLKAGDLLIPYVDQFMDDGAAHGLYARFNDVKDLILSDTNEKISNLGGKEKSTSEQINVMGEKLTQLEEELAKLDKEKDKLKEQNGKIILAMGDSAILSADDQEQLNKLGNNFYSMILKLDKDMENVKEQLGSIMDFYLAFDMNNVLLKDAEGNIDLLKGELQADGVVAGAFTVKVSDKDNKTIGENYIEAVKTDADEDGIDDETGTDGKSWFVKTKAVTKTCKIFVTPKIPIDQAIAVTQLKDGEGFQVELKDPVKSDVHFNWILVEEK